MVPHVKVAPERPANSSRVVTTGGDDLLCAMRAEMRGFAALLLCFAAVAAAGLQLQMRLTGVMRWGCPVTRVEFECDATPARNSPVCLSRCIQ